MHKVEVHPLVYEELEQARLWYENQAEGLGEEFLNSVDFALKTVQNSPETWPGYLVKFKRFLVHRFPFAIIYQYDENKIQIIAVAHLKRRPCYWESRKF